MRRSMLFVMILVVALTVPAFAQIVVPSRGAQAPGDSKGVELTVYNVNMALVKDTRPITLKRGLNTIEFQDVAASIDPTSVHFKSLTAPQSCVIREQNYQYDLVSRAKLLEKYIGKQITIKEEHGDGKVTSTEGTLLSARDGFVVQTPQKILITSPESIELPSLPEGLIVKPTLKWLVDATRPGKHSVEVSYITNDIKWDCDYVAVINAKDTQLDFNGWVTIDNRSGAAYEDARLKLIAGDVRRVQPPVPASPRVMRAELAMAAGGPPQFEEKAFFEYHMYTLGRTTTVADNETKQVELLTAAGVPVQKRYFFDGQRQRRDEQDRAKAQVKLEFANSERNNVGMPLPKGKVRVYKADDDESLQFVGEDNIDHTPRDEKVRLYLGDAFDVVGEWRQMSQKQIAANVREMTVQIKLRNHKDENIDVTCTEHSYGDWRMIEETHKSTKTDARTFEYTVPVPRDGETTITYTIRITN